MENSIVRRCSQVIGEHKEYDHCRFCGQKTLKPFLSFGNVPLAGGFLLSDQKRILAKERLYPLTIVFCSTCKLVQVREVIETKTLFKEYFYRSSAIGTLTAHFQQYAKLLGAKFTKSKHAFIVEIGSNDGVLLRPLHEAGFKVLGVDPAENIVRSLSQLETPTLCACFGKQTAQQIAENYGLADCIVTSNSFAHIDDMHDVMEGVKLLLAPEGQLLIETHYLGTLLRESQYDMMYHEHQSYYTLIALENLLSQYDMEVFDAYAIPMHGGSMHYEVQHKETGVQKISPRVSALRRQEKQRGFDALTTYKKFSSDIAQEKRALLKLLQELRAQGKRIVGYGASGRATMIMSYCGITADHIDCVVDDAPAKQGAFTPGNHLPIFSSKILRDQDRPDYCLLFAWSFANEIIKRNSEYIERGGQFIVPLPQVRILS